MTYYLVAINLIQMRHYQIYFYVFYLIPTVLQ